jgi:tetratricopeptide (TPR) repeat protein/DNA-binding CsgD family transcriptional regulator
MAETLEELQQQLAGTKDAIRKIDLLIAIGWKTHRTDPSGALKLARQAARMASLKKEKDRMAESMLLEGGCRLYTGEYPAAIERLEQALSLTDETGNKRLTVRILQALSLVHSETGENLRGFDSLARALEVAQQEELRNMLPALHNSMGVAYSLIGDYTHALHHYSLVEQVSEELDDPAWVIRASDNIGNIYMRLGDYAKADEQYRKREALALPEGIDKRDEIATHMVRGQIYEGMGNFDEALREFAEGLELSRELNDDVHHAGLLQLIGDVHLDQKRFAEAREAYQQAWDILEGLNHGARWSLLLSLAHAEFGLANYSQAQEHALQALEEEMKRQGRMNEHIAHHLLSQIYEELGDALNALKHHKLYTKAKEENIGAEQQKQMEQMRMRSEIERAEKEREIMRLEKQRLEEEMQHKQKELAAMALHIVEKNQFLDSLKRDMQDVAQSLDGAARPAVKGLMRQVDTNIGSQDDWKAFEEQFEAVHHGFITKLAQRYPKLTRTELKVCALLKIQMSTKEIANILATTTKNIEIHRYRIRKKLGLSTEQSFTVAFAEIQG